MNAVATIHQAIDAKSPCLALISAAEPTLGPIILTQLIRSLVLFFNVGKTMNDAQIVETINLLMVDQVTKNLTPEDYHVCFSRMKSGYYGKSYDRIDGQIIFIALYDYANEKMDVIESNSIKKSTELRENENREIWTPEMLSMLKTTLKSVSENQPKKEVKPANREKGLITEWFADFDKKFIEAPHGEHGKFILIDEQPMNQDDYIAYRYKQYCDARTPD